jgi:hypothetical protein
MFAQIASALCHVYFQVVYAVVGVRDEALEDGGREVIRTLWGQA